MPVIDDRGRLFGRVNLIDAVVGIFVLLLLPLAYGAYRLFRVPVPTITAMSPTTFEENATAVVGLSGENLLPFMRARVGTAEAAFLVQSPAVAELKVPPMSAGTYDLSLFDETNRVVFKPAAFVVTPRKIAVVSEWLEMEAVGAFVGVTASSSLDTSTTFKAASGSPAGAPPVRVLAVRPAEPLSTRVKIAPSTFTTAQLKDLRVPAIIKFSCAVAAGACAFDGTPLEPDATLTLTRPDGVAVQFTIEQLFPPGTHAALPSIVTARVRFAGGAELLQTMKAGDADLNEIVRDSERFQLIDPRHAVLLTVGADPQMVNAVLSAEGVLRRSVQVQQSVLAFTCTVRVPVTATPAGWTYKERAVKVGAPFVFESTAGAMTGWILDVR